MTTVAAVDHWQAFVEFCAYEVAVGGPDPHLRTVGLLSIDKNIEDRWWRAGCYAAFYNVPSAEVVWQHWPWPTARNNPAGFTAWIHQNWKGFKFRRERRAVRTPDKLARCLLSYAEWETRLPGLYQRLNGSSSAYDDLWNAVVNDVYGMGRYIASRLVEVYHRYCGAPQGQYDIHAKDGWSPRSTLVLLYPEHADSIQPHSNVPAALAFSDHLAAQTLTRLAQTHHLPGLDYRSLESCLCDYKQSYEDKRQFPGRSADSELEYYHAIAPYWGTSYNTDMWAARAKLIAPEARGELHGWNAVREQLGGVLREHNYTWSDLRYDYLATSNLAIPIEREGRTHEAVLHLARTALARRQNEPTTYAP